VNAVAAVRTTCPYCGVGCGVRVTPHAANVTVAGDPEHPANLGRLCSKGAALGETLGMDGRLLNPRVLGHDTDWAAALGYVADGFRRIIAEHGADAVAFYVSGQLLTEDYYVANKLMKGYIGSANIDTNSRLCMSSAVAAHKRAFGEDVVPVSYEDVELADLIVLVGSNTAWCHPVLFQRIVKAKERRPDLKIVVIDPRTTTTGEIADLHLPVAAGTDVRLFNGLLHHLHRHGIEDHEFIDAHTEGFNPALSVAQASAASIADVARCCRLDAAAVERFYVLFAQTPRVVTLFSQGVNQSSAGTDKANSIINCHLMTGRIGRPGAGPFSITGQPNAMGGREVGGLANMLAAHRDLEDPEHRRIVQEFWASPTIASRPGLKAVDLFEAMHAGRVKAIWIAGTNPVVSMPNADRARAALRRCELVVVSDRVRARAAARGGLGREGRHRHQLRALHLPTARLSRVARRRQAGLVDLRGSGTRDGIHERLRLPVRTCRVRRTCAAVRDGRRGRPRAHRQPRVQLERLGNARCRRLRRARAAPLGRSRVRRRPLLASRWPGTLHRHPATPTRPCA
jgi:assimilatory nitrate reductase catalytic subunit